MGRGGGGGGGGSCGSCWGCGGGGGFGCRCGLRGGCGCGVGCCGGWAGGGGGGGGRDWGASVSGVRHRSGREGGGGGCCCCVGRGEGCGPCGRGGDGSAPGCGVEGCSGDGPTTARSRSAPTPAYCPSRWRASGSSSAIERSEVSPSCSRRARLREWPAGGCVGVDAEPVRPVAAAAACTRALMLEAANWATAVALSAVVAGPALTSDALLSPSRVASRGSSVGSSSSSVGSVPAPRWASNRSAVDGWWSWRSAGLMGGEWLEGLAGLAGLGCWPGEGGGEGGGRSGGRMCGTELEGVTGGRGSAGVVWGRAGVLGGVEVLGGAAAGGWQAWHQRDRRIGSGGRPASAASMAWTVELMQEWQRRWRQGIRRTPAT